MSISKVQVPESSHRLMLAIGDAIRAFTTQAAMSEENIVGVLGFCTGAAVAKASRGRNSRRLMRDMAVANVDMGLQAMTSSMASTSLILPDGFQ